MATKMPPLKWAQRREKVFVNFEEVDLKPEDVSVQMADGLLSIEATKGDKSWKLENMPLFAEIDVEESKWFMTGRCARERLPNAPRRLPTPPPRPRAGSL